MADLSQLMGLEGAVAAFAMNDRGELLEHRIAAGNDIGPQALDLLSHMCVANMAIATMQARGWEAASEYQGFYPIQGFTLVGFDWSAVTNGRVGVVVRNQQVDYQAAYALLDRHGEGG